MILGTKSSGLIPFAVVSYYGELHKYMQLKLIKAMKARGSEGCES